MITYIDFPLFDIHDEIVEGLEAGVLPCDIAKELDVDILAVYQVLEEQAIYGH